MATVRDLITDSLKELGAIGIGEVPSADEIQDGLSVLNNLIGTWRTESLLVYGMDETVFPYVGGQANYTIGIGGDFNMPRPDTIESAYNRDSNNNDYGIFCTNDYQIYSNIITKTTSASLVTVLYYNSGVPLGNVILWPVPSDSNYRLVLWTWQVVTSFATIDDVIVLPPGYQRALTFNLAIELSGRYGRQPMATTVSIAVESKAQIKRINTVVPLMGFDSAMTGDGRSFNYLTGNF